MNRPVLLMLPIFASLHHLTAAASSITAEDTGCRPATCGNLTITYPFWLAGRDTSCGPPGFQLTCYSSAAGAFLIGSYIMVLDIDYGSRSLVAAHAQLAAFGACGNNLFNVSSALAIMNRFVISASNREIYVMYNCNGTLPLPGAVPVTNCSDKSSNFVYLGGSYGTAQPPANDGSCELAELLVLVSEAAGATTASYRRLIKAGFRLEWRPVGDCQSCRSSGGRCRYDNNTAAFACLCSDGSLRSSTCGGKHKSKLTLIERIQIICLQILLHR